MVAVVREHERKLRDYEARHGRVLGPIISWEFAGHRLVAVGSKLHWAKESALKVFPDFLNQYLHSALGKEWGARQVSLEFENNTRSCSGERSGPKGNSARGPTATGSTRPTAAPASLGFGSRTTYICLNTTNELQRKLLRRLRDPRAFQGARLEVVAAAAMLPAGYELDFEDDKLPGKHAEFVASQKGSDHKLAVEAKSRHRPGVMGFKGERLVSQKAEIAGLLKEAVAKDPEPPLLVFIELNMPILVPEGSLPAELAGELEHAWKEVQTAGWPNGFPAIGVVFYNDATPWFLEEMSSASAEVFALAMPADKHRHVFDEQQLLPVIMKCELPAPHDSKGIPQVDFHGSEPTPVEARRRPRSTPRFAIMMGDRDSM